MSRNSEPDYTMQPEPDQLREDIFLKLDLTGKRVAVFRILDELRTLMEFGVSSGFTNDLIKDTQIKNKWSLWIKEIKALVTESGYSSSEVEKVSISTHQKKISSQSKLICHIDLADNLNEKQAKNLNIRGLKLIFIAMLLANKESIGQLSLKDLSKIFRSGIGYIELFPKLQLNFETSESLEELYEQCEKLISEQYREGNSLNRFLRNLRDSLVVLLGYRLGSRFGRNQSSSTKEYWDSKKGSKPKTIRLTPYYSLKDIREEKSIGEVLELSTEPEEESVIGFIDSRSDDDMEFGIKPEILESHANVKSKFWIENFNSSMPWSNRGISPFSTNILIKWIKDNDTDVSLMLGLMLCVGRRFEEVLGFICSEDGDISLGGEYLKKYLAPDDRLIPGDELKDVIERNTSIVSLSLPFVLKKRFKKRFQSVSEGMNLESLWPLNVNVTQFKSEVVEKLKQIKSNGAAGISMDRIPLLLEKRISSYTNDTFIGYVLIGRESDAPPISSYYTAYTQVQLTKVYEEIIGELFK